jgi:hypothetical protein
MKRKLYPLFDEQPSFEVTPEYAKPSHPARATETFRRLQSALVGRLFDETETLTVRKRLNAAVNEAAALSWTTPFPVLVFPLLLAEKAHEAKVTAHRQQTITAETEGLTACMV